MERQTIIARSRGVKAWRTRLGEGWARGKGRRAGDSWRSSSHTAHCLVNVELGLGGAVCTAGTACLLLLHAEVDLGFGIVAHGGLLHGVRSRAGRRGGGVNYCTQLTRLGQLQHACPSPCADRRGAWMSLSALSLTRRRTRHRDSDTGRAHALSRHICHAVSQSTLHSLTGY